MTTTNWALPRPKSQEPSKRGELKWEVSKGCAFWKGQMKAKWSESEEKKQSHLNLPRQSGSSWVAHSSSTCESRGAAQGLFWCLSLTVRSILKGPTQSQDWLCPDTVKWFNILNERPTIDAKFRASRRLRLMKRSVRSPRNWISEWGFRLFANDTTIGGSWGLLTSGLTPSSTFLGRVLMTGPRSTLLPDHFMRAKAFFYSRERCSPVSVSGIYWSHGDRKELWTRSWPVANFTSFTGRSFPFLLCNPFGPGTQMWQVPLRIIIILTVIPFRFQANRDVTGQNQRREYVRVSNPFHSSKIAPCHCFLFSTVRWHLAQFNFRESRLKHVNQQHLCKSIDGVDVRECFRCRVWWWTRMMGSELSERKGRESLIWKKNRVWLR
jgi:hypothetical protein